MTTSLTVYQQEIVCHDNISNEDVVHHDIWKPFVYESCPDNNPDHTFNITLIMITVSNTIANLISDARETSGTYRNQEFDFNIPAGPSTDYPVVGTKTFPYNTRFVAYEFVPTEDNVGDSFSLYIVPPTFVGVLIESVDGGNTIKVSNSILSKITLGVEVILDDGVNVQNLGECTNINLDTRILTVENNIDFSFSSGTPITLRFPVSKNIRIHSTDVIKFGTNMPGNKLIHKGLVITLCYNNASVDSKTILLRAEMFV